MNAELLVRCSNSSRMKIKESNNSKTNVSTDRNKTEIAGETYKRSRLDLKFKKTRVAEGLVSLLFLLRLR